jgi:hypothetical protein
VPPTARSEATAVPEASGLGEDDATCCDGVCTSRLPSAATSTMTAPGSIPEQDDEDGNGNGNDNDTDAEEEAAPGGGGQHGGGVQQLTDELQFTLTLEDADTGAAAAAAATGADATLLGSDVRDGITLGNRRVVVVNSMDGAAAGAHTCLTALVRCACCSCGFGHLRCCCVGGMQCIHCLFSYANGIACHVK